MSREIRIGNTAIGGENHIVIQSMLNAHHLDVDGNVEQAKKLEAAGCEIIRVSVPNSEALKLIPAIKNAVEIPLVADIHFDYKMAVQSVEYGADKIRINPGNIGSEDNVKAVVDACRVRNIPIRVGVNGGSLEKDILEKYQGRTPEAIAESALRNVALIEKFDYDNIVISAKSSDVATMVKANRLIAANTDYPIHIGITEAGVPSIGFTKSAIGIGALLIDEIGDTIRVSLTGDSVEEVEAARRILKSINKFKCIDIISCPTCGRTEIDLPSIAEEVAERTKNMHKNLKVAIMGCVVNGPGEASHADIGIAGGKDCAILFKRGQIVRKLTENYVETLLEEIEKM
ncbi:MAG: flavodoxin-dependent (E)-4-hydroxy-3-methylbut-2-enyl-diphosphate synthase [Oscillospiraceae bacterium]|nr:flavodoxin-dependent (E)-4-hydroxy-3-methylbut-2-enyl-diphosphate synthase [Oscillospiraceae bacterium]